MKGYVRVHCAAQSPTAGLYAQYGCGFCAPREWLNFDASPTLRFERVPLIGLLYTRNVRRFPANVRYGDILKGLPLPNDSCAAIYASHVLEHLPLDDCYLALRNTHNLLRTGGVFRAVVPDLHSAAKNYMARFEQGDRDASAAFLRDARLGSERRPSSLLHEWLQHSKHLWMWDQISLSQAFDDAGFRQIRICTFGDSSDPMFALVEEPERFRDAVCIQGTK